MPTFEEAIISGIVDSFFKSQPGFQDPTGAITYNPSPALGIAQQLFNSKKDVIMTAILEKLDLDKLAEDISKQVVETLKTPAYNSWDRFKPDQERLRSAIIQKVAAAKAEELLAEETDK